MSIAPSSKRQLIILVVSVLFSIRLCLPDITHADTQRETESQVITAAVLNDFPPLYLLDKQGKPDGIAIDILRHVADQAGLRVHYRVVNNWAEAIQAVRTGEADIVPGIAKDPSTERMAEFIFSHNTETIPVSCFVRAKNDSIKGIGSLPGHKVGVIMGGAAERVLKAQGDIDLVSCDDIDSCLMQLLTGEVDAIVLPEPVLLKKARLAGLEGKVKVVGKPLMELQRGFLFRKADSRLLSLLDPHIVKYTRSSDFTDLYGKWYGRPTPFWTVSRVFWTMFGVLLALVVIGLFWRNYSISRVNKMLTKNIDERKKAEKQTALSIERFETVMDGIDALVYVADMETYEVLFVNKYGRNIWGEITGKTCWRELQSGQDGPCLFCTNAKLLDPNGQPTEVLVWEFQNTVNKKWYQCRDQAIKWTDERFVRMEIAVDISLHKKTEESLAEEKERLAVTLRSIGDGVITTDISGNVILLNKIAENLTGWSTADALGRPLEEVFHIINEQTKAACENPAEKVINSGQIVGLANHTILIAKDGRERSIADSGAPILDAHSSIIGVVLVFRDVSEQIKTEKELLKFRKLESLGVLAGGIAHDFNNILAAIIGNINLAELDPNLSPETKELLGAAHKASLRAKGLTQQLLTFSKGGEPVKEVASLESVIKDSATFVIHGDNVACHYEIPEDLWLVDIDKGQMSQVVQNIVINASHAMPEGGIIQITCKNIDPLQAKGIALPRDKKFVEVTITDSGIGMPANVIDRIFDPYFSTKQKGSGLGLAICHSIITKHDGYVSVKSTPGVGSTFTLYIPASTHQEEKEKREEAIEIYTAKAKVMIMDDEQMVRDVTKAMLIRLGHEAVLAQDGAEALKLYKEHYDSDEPIDIVIMDLTIPGGMGGQDAVRELLAFDPDAKVIVSSGYSNDPIMANYQKHGFCATIVKPYQVNELEMIINKVIIKRQ